jgi:hypothetical protein
VLKCVNHVVGYNSSLLQHPQECKSNIKHRLQLPEGVCTARDPNLYTVKTGLWPTETRQFQSRGAKSYIYGVSDRLLVYFKIRPILTRVFFLCSNHCYNRHVVP